MKVKFLMGPSDCNDKNIPSYSKNFLEQLSQALGEEVTTGELEDMENQAFPVYFIASGGAENGFKACYKKTKEPYILLTTPAYNSLAASMEIMGFLQDKGRRGEILHGNFETIAKRLSILTRVEETKKALKAMKMGCFGEPGGLISSDADFTSLKIRYGISHQMFQLEELVEEYQKGGYEENIYTRELKTKGYSPEEVEKALDVYGALKRLIEKYELTSVTVRCFDLLELIHTTGCLALAILNAEGIPAACEGDQKSLLSMMILQKLTGKSGFLANPSCMSPEKSEIIFAHCTLPIDMPEDYYLTTHFESGIGVAISCDISPQTMTIFKCNGDMTRYYAGRAELIETMHRADLCRSQMRLHLLDGTDYFSLAPISNHHIICKGDYKELIDEFFKEDNLMIATNFL